MSVVVATISSAANFVVEIGDQPLSALVQSTGGWDQFATTDLGTVELKQAGRLEVKVHAKEGAEWHAINLNSVALVPTGQP